MECIEKKREANLKSHRVKRDVCLPLTITFLLFSDSDLVGNPEKYHEENYNSKVAYAHT